MKKTINIKPIHQTGHNCKPTAIATIDQYYGQKFGFTPLPLHKEKKHPISIRELAKRHGSLQGELLEMRQMEKILNDLGYETEVVDFNNHPDLFKHTIKKSLAAGDMVIACFAVDTYTGAPTFNPKGDTEHAAIINGINEDLGLIKMIHWEEEYQTTIDTFYYSSISLPHTRSPEYYVNVKERGQQRDKMRKYDKAAAQDDSALSLGARKTITPEIGSGFGGKLLIIKEPKLENILSRRKTLLAKPKNQQEKDYFALLKRLKIKKEELREHHGLKYQHAYKTTIQLIKDLDYAGRQFFAKPEKMTSTDHINQLQEQVHQALSLASIELKKHRGFGELHIFWRSILGVLALIPLCIPAIIVACKSRHGYHKTFFTETTTDSEEQLEQLQERADQLFNVFKAGL